jgi:hypothetical protein
MNKLWTLERPRDNKRVEFYSELRNGQQTYIIRELGESQDSVTTDAEVVRDFRKRLLSEGYVQASAGT